MSETKTAKFKPGKVLEDKWIIIELIGKGAMGEVYRAHQANLNRDVAIKIISEDVMSEIGDDPEELKVAFGRFRREVQTMAQVRHTNILTIYDYGEIEDLDSSENSRIAYIVMEYIPGNSLRFTLSEDGLDDAPELYEKWIRDYFLPILEGVEVLHNNEIIHRDLKPENVFMDGDIPKIADFGLARSFQMKAVTTSLEMLGTLAYMSPEQCSDFKTANYTTDIYALGKILFEAVYGTLTEKVVPFTSVTIDDPQTDFLVEVNSIIKKATEEKPESRYQTIQELRSDLQKALLLQSHVTQQEQEDHEVTGGRARITRSQFTLLLIGFSIAALSVVSMGIYHFIDKPELLVGIEESSYADHTDFTRNQHIVSTENTEMLAPSIIGRDGTQMILSGSTDNKTIDVNLFYMDEEMITNFQFVEFLNTFGKKFTVKNGVVRDGETIILYIGDGSANEDVILFKHGRFHLKDQDNGSNPIVRVTYHGAHKYAAAYGKELLLDKEWWHAYQYHSQTTEPRDHAGLQSEEQNSPNMMHGAISIRQEESSSISGAMGVTYKEWVQITTVFPNVQDSLPNEEIVSASGVLDIQEYGESGQALKRFPWEGFDDVGFRTKVGIINK